ncbi:MAG TPA: hypothetical protein VFA99_02330 [Acidobacteriaceae bacterium]|nr:hypothetical protein [Acidobacteriaceae bacterium]
MSIDVASYSSLIPSPYGTLLGGIAVLAVAVISTCTGKALGRGSIVYRAEDGGDFWMIVAIYYVFGVFLILIFLSNVC